ncbi:hypothetical protein B0T11DRAFT_278324 [Plectosphaerella cucumerina]|uniref:Thymidylate kinase n=1 Tax=Plectosphaerella cucumerina TaxID=40658 RepID=A0A8K0TKH1_9PEZI|nr:hypothetical protein B0T11DRAFT_278324 [Plectosphaerella cucumerina]
MSTLSRQPFAPLDGARLQTLTSLKNRQNAIAPAGSKRKAADIVDTDDSENLDPTLSSKRSKATVSSFPLKDAFKPSSYILNTKPTVAKEPLSTPARPVTSPRRAVLHAKSPAAKLNTFIAKSSPLSAPAGRSPTRGKRSGILSSRRRTAGPYTRVDPPAFNIASAAPFSLDAALKGTIPSYAARTPVMPTARASSRSALAKDLDDAALKASWFFDIHEDTPEQEMTNMLQHGTCVLDISSDEESERKATREQAEGRDKENVPPADDVSQTTFRRSARQADENEMVVEKQRMAMGELDVAALYADGFDESSVFIIPADEDEETDIEGPNDEPPRRSSFQFSAELNLEETVVSEAIFEPVTEVAPEAEIDTKKAVDDLMAPSTEPAPEAAVLQPIEGTGETFDLWESGSSKDEAEPVLAV